MEACHLVSSQASLRHLQLVSVPDRMLCPFQWSLLIAHVILSLVPLLHFHGTWIYSCMSWRLGSLLCLHAFLIELQVDAVSRDCESSIIIVFTRSPSSSSDHLSDFTTQRGLNTAMVTKFEEGRATRNKRFVRAKHRHNILINIDITDQGNWMNESAKADDIFVAS